MNTLTRPLRSTFNTSALAARHRLAMRPAVCNSLLLHARTEANSVGIKGGSQSLSHARENIKEEAKNSTADLAKMIAGANVYSVKEAAAPGFMGTTRSIASEVPKPVMFFGLVGGVPYIGTAVTTVYLAHEAGLAAAGKLAHIDPGVAITMVDQALNIQVTYGAVMLSFLGALHWGMEFAGLGGYKGYRRLALGAAPVVYAWSTLALDPTLALAAQWAGFTGLWWADLQATSAGWTPRWYSQYRFYLSILTGTCILGSLAGITYWGPVGGHGLLDHELHMIRDQRKALMEQPATRYGTEMTIVEGAGDSFTHVRKTEDIENEAAEKAGKDEKKDGKDGEKGGKDE
ncbi:hypothetical protein C8F04DRAFT_1116709 [Mycena alexandri]|uniref:Mnn4-regulates the mannosylphosphorylation n=1 Tax=Mycena alexandri TaxID=1745969 RepID=A0AAD6WVX2_9AGAR|nr:hypothetical protein C8F04DRAFT_1116709 [Mycena alexandri]